MSAFLQLGKPPGGSAGDLWSGAILIPMEFCITDTFTTNLARLTGDEQKTAKTTAFDLQLDASLPDLSFHRVDRAKDRNI